MDTLATRHEARVAHLMRRGFARDEAAGATCGPAEMLNLLGEVFERGARRRMGDAASRERLTDADMQLLSAAHGKLPKGKAKLRRSLAKDRRRILGCREDG